jgi:hypothetical protein
MVQSDQRNVIFSDAQLLVWIREATRKAARGAIVSAIREGRLAVPGTAADHRAAEGG